MSTFEDQIDDSNCICPYCKSSYQVESGDYNSDVREAECDDCGKKYFLSQDFSVSTITEPDCTLNGEHHDYQQKPLRDGKFAPFCTVCGKCQPLRERPAVQS